MLILQSLNRVTPLPRSHREARRPEASLVRSRACSSGDSPEEKPHGTARPREGGLRTMPRTLPSVGEQPARLEGDQVLRPQPHPAAEEAGEEGERGCSLLGPSADAAQDRYHNVKTTSNHNEEEKL